MALTKNAHKRGPFSWTQEAETGAKDGRLFTIRVKEEVEEGGRAKKKCSSPPFFQDIMTTQVISPIFVCVQFSKSKFDHRPSVLIDLVSLVSPAVCNIAEVSWESSQLPQPLQLPPLAPTTSPGLQTLQPWEL